MTAVPMPGEAAGGAQPLPIRRLAADGRAGDVAERDGAARDGAEGDGRLLARARGGDRAAFGELVTRNHRVIASLVRQLVGRNGPVEDLVQETFARALGKLDGFRGQASFSTWAATIALNLSRDWVRKQARRRRLAPTADIEADQVARPGGDRGAARIEIREEADRIRAAMQALPERVQIAITMRVVNDEPYSVIAERLGTHVPTARTWVSRGLRAVRDVLEVQDDER